MAGIRDGWDQGWLGSGMPETSDGLASAMAVFLVGALTQAMSDFTGE